MTTPPHHVCVRAVHHLNELSHLEHKEKVFVVFQEAGVQLVHCVDRLTHPATQHKLLYLLTVPDRCKFLVEVLSCGAGKGFRCGAVPMMHQVR